MPRIPVGVALCLASILFVACHPGPVAGGTPIRVGGTIAGVVTAAGGTAVPSRKVTATNTATGQRFDTTTASNGGYTMKVPEGTYRLELELRPGETLDKQPGETHINNGDLDPGRDFQINVKTGGA
jgi:Carboxypeptidase regulatory-like domain